MDEAIMEKARKESAELLLRRERSNASIILEKEKIARIESEYFSKMSMHAGKIHKEYQEITIIGERLKLLAELIKRREEHPKKVLSRDPTVIFDERDSVLLFSEKY
jgi:hypothetical protein